MIRFRRRNTAWLIALAMLTALGLAAAPSFVVQFVLLSIFALAGLGSLLEIGRERETLLDALRRAPIRSRVSPQAKEASERARGSGGYANNDLMLLDVGLIAVQASYEGMAMRRTRSISKDDGGVRPFITLNIDAAEAERNANIRFELRNQNGDNIFVHEMRTYLREGEMSIMTDHHLPLAGNRDVQGTGDWDLRVYVDGNLLGMHSFMLAPSMNERQRRLATDEEMEAAFDSYEIVDEVAQEAPARLQDLLTDASTEQQRGTQASNPQEQSRLQDNNSSRSRTEDGSIRRSRTVSRRRR